jgi:hypothetical protein
MLPKTLDEARHPVATRTILDEKNITDEDGKTHGRDDSTSFPTDGSGFATDGFGFATDGFLDFLGVRDEIVQKYSGRRSHGSDRCTDELIHYQYTIKKILRCDLQRT